MDTDIGNPIEYNPNMDDKDNDSSQIDPQFFYSQQQQPPPSVMMPPPYPIMDEPQKIDLFASFDKNVYIIIFISFILGFFMGKTQQPIVLRPV